MDINQPVKILFAEDAPTDVEIAKRRLKKEGLDFIFRLVDTEEDFRRGLKEFDPDVIISDYSMPSFDGMTALQIARSAEKFYPFIIFTGSMNEETAVACMKAGANDYVIKEQITRLPFAVIEALNKKQALMEKNKMEKSLIESEEKFRNLFYNHSAVKLIIDPETLDIYEANMAASEFYGWPIEKLESMKVTDINDIGENEVRKNIAKVVRGIKNNFQLKHRKADGDTVDVEVFSSHVQIGGKIYIHSIIHNITEQKRLEEQLRQSQKLESVGRLAGGIAHDFNNILTVILNYCELALMELDSSSELTGYIKEIKKAGERSSEITSQLLAFARKQHNHPKVMNLNDSINDMIGMLQRLIGENIGLVWLPAENICPIKMDSSQLHQILANLCINARDAIGDSGKITIETSCVSIDENYAGKNPDFLPGEFVMLAVSDNGCGMDKSTVENIFEPFFTTKGAGEGTGLGLSTVYGIVKQNGGFVNVYSEIGKGTTFKIYLKCESEEAEKAEEEQKAVPTESKGETVLIVEDEEAILHISEKMLETLGYNLLTANNPLDAIKIAKDYNGNIDIIVTDVVMPDMNGKEMSEKITKLHPNAKVLFISGYTFNVIGQHGLFEENVNFIQKPFNVREFRSKIREILDEK
ncbi:MAG TPA: hybrid sensor histidine kinase/response regulator [Flexistipes sinusarabici]|uniref:histidine kinase n=1 Tax=Flexistipes sinusarabici TaxID=2352 RepID=A0A3D5QDW5_FLESI|nr:hybrid sensor histidine kinase/response regulator [Flexistipes sinusarabici]